MGTYRIKERGTGKIVVSDFQADGPAKAESRCPRPKGDYVIELVSAGSQSRAVQLREASRTLMDVQQMVLDAVASDAPDAQDIQIFDDGTLLYRIDGEMFQRTWSVRDAQDSQPVVTLGASQKVELVAQPVEAYVFAWKDNPDQRVTILAENRQQAHARLDNLNRLAESFGLSGQAAIEFIRGRDTTGATQVDRFAALMGNGPDDRSERTMRMAREAARGRY
jgi:hypothetical protein